MPLPWDVLKTTESSNALKKQYNYGARFLLVLGAMKGYEVELRLD